MRRLSLCWFVLAACGGAPGGGGGNGRCLNLWESNNFRCADYKGLGATELQGYKETCGAYAYMGKASVPAFSSESCPTANIIGGCRFDNGNGGTATEWFYKAWFTESEVKSVYCLGMSFVPPP